MKKRAQYYSERFLQYFDGIFPEGSPINAVQFKPRDATGKIENIEIALNCISEVVYQVFSSLNLSGQSITLPVRFVFFLFLFIIIIIIIIIKCL